MTHADWVEGCLITFIFKLAYGGTCSMVEIASSTHENKPDYKYTYIAAFHFPRPQSYRPQRETTTYFKSFFSGASNSILLHYFTPQTQCGKTSSFQQDQKSMEKKKKNSSVTSSFFLTLQMTSSEAKALSVIKTSAMIRWHHINWLNVLDG